MCDTVGKKLWIIPDCELPPPGDGVLKGHESVIVVNDSDTDAEIRVKLFFVDRDCYEGITWRVEKNRLSIRYVRIKRASMLYGQYDPETINQFFADWRAFGLSRLEEWANIETSHRALMEGKWQGVEYFAHWTGEEQELF